MKVELVVNGSVVAEFDGSPENVLRFQAANLNCMVQAQDAYATERRERTRAKLEKLHEMQFGLFKTAPKGPLLADPEA